MEQLLATTPGVTYDLTYFLAVSEPFLAVPRAFTAGATVEFLAQVNGVTVFDQSNIPPQPYTRYSFPFIATGTSTDVKFGFRNDPGAFFLDDISVNAVPEPSSVWLGLLVTAFAIVVVRRRLPASAEPRS
jgi:PEP-CTERM motif-containing protein